MLGKDLAPEGAPEAGADPKDQFSALVGNISDGMAMLTDVMGQINPDAAGELAGIADQFKSAVEKALTGGGAPSPSAGMVSPEARGAKAVPVSPQGMARG